MKTSSKNYTIKKIIKNNGKPKITNLIEEFANDAFNGVTSIRNLDDVYDNIASVVSDMIAYLKHERPDVGIINFKVVANENNNPDVTKKPFTLEIQYRHKDSTVPTIIQYVIDDIKPAEVVDKFAPWRK